MTSEILRCAQNDIERRIQSGLPKRLCRAGMRSHSEKPFTRHFEERVKKGFHFLDSSEFIFSNVNYEFEGKLRDEESLDQETIRNLIYEMKN